MIRWRPDAASGSFFARDNTANFLYWCCKIGVEQSHLFESEDLGEYSNQHLIMRCLHFLFAYIFEIYTVFVIKPTRFFGFNTCAHKSVR